MYRAILALLSSLSAQMSIMTAIKSLLQTLITTETANNADVADRLQAIQDRIEANAKPIASIVASLAQLQTKMDNMTAILSQFGGQFGPLIGETSDIKAGVDQANASLAEIVRALQPLNIPMVEIVFGKPVPNSSPAPQVRPTVRR